MSFEKVRDMGLSNTEQDELIDELTTRAIEQIYPTTDALVTELRSGRRLTAYMGIDPTAPDMHVGHESQLFKLQRLQRLGHDVILLIGDFTAMIGDPSDKAATRVKLSRDEVLANAEGYKQQASKVLDFEHEDNPVQLRYNSEWLGAMGFGDVLELAGEFTVQQMLERKTFKDRIDAGKPLSLLEFMYPLMQGWDSVAMGVDIEVGGSDQIFNMLSGSTLVRRHLSKEKYVIAGKLLVDPSGKKIGKTEGNMITLNDAPLDMFHKIMMWGDGITPHALELCSDMPMDAIAELKRKLDAKELSGVEGKLILARSIVADLHGDAAATLAQSEYTELTSKGLDLDPDKFQTCSVGVDQTIAEILHIAGLASSKSDARRLLGGNAVRVNGQTVDDSWGASQLKTGDILQVGKKKIENHRKIVIEE